VCIRADVELGGTDQTFNNLVGRDLQKLDNQKPQIVLTMPILVGLDGVEKMSKSKGNYIGVTDEPNDMFGKVMSISDTLMENYYTLLTDLPMDEVKVLVDPARTHPKEAKVRLGKIIVTQFYDQDAAQAAADHFDKVFKQKEIPDDMPVVTLVSDPMMASKLLVACELVASGGEGKRMVKQGGVSVNGPKIKDPNQEITPEDGMVVQVGKRRFARVAVQ
ncbi:MAG: tyrosine--tRNA ligase, partial [Planctomycetes bacterium]|nr:tyrosine--tRNA ligase [Planctomycetota bacterium]